MDHTIIEDQSLVDRYIQGRLTPPERVEFEDHFIDCDQCLEQLELAEAFRTGVRDAVAGEVVRTTAQAGVAGLLIRLLRARQTAAWILVCGLALPIAWWLGRAGAPVPGDLRSPQVNVTTYAFGASRSDLGAESLTVAVGEWLAVELPTAGDTFPGYRVALVRQSGGAVLWAGDGLQPDRQDRVRITFPPGSLPAGALWLDLYGVPGTGEAVRLARYPLRAEP
jgi:hypothetical protein